MPRSTASRCPPWTPRDGGRRPDPRDRRARRPGLPRLPRACAAASTCRRYLGSRSTFTLGGFGGHDGRALAGRRRAAGRRRRRRPTRRRSPPGMAPELAPRVAHRGARRAAHRARVPDRRRPRRAAAAPSGRCTTTRRAPACAWSARGPAGPRRRRRGRAAPVEHPRHRLRDRRGRPDRRHAGHPRSRRPQPGRVRVPRGRRRRRAVEARPARARRPRAARARGRQDRADAAWRRRIDFLRSGDATGSSPSPGRPGTPSVPARTTHRATPCSPPRAGRRRRPVGDLPPGRRPVPARRVRRHAPRPGAAGPGPRARRVGRASTSAPGLVDATAGVRSLLIQVDGDRLGVAGGLRRRAARAWPTWSTWTTTPFPSRVVHLPLSWDDPATREAIDRYVHGVRADAPWCPWNIEFIRRINGLDVGRRRAPDRARRVVPRARPRRRLPGRAGGHAARPSPPPGHHQVQPGAHLDPRERGRHRRRLPVHLRHGGPGGYQFVGRTVQVWNRDALGPHFDRAVAAAQLRPHPLVPGRRRRAARPARRAGAWSSWSWTSRTAAFRLSDHRAFLAEHAEEIDDVPATPAGRRSTGSDAPGPTPGSSTDERRCTVSAQPARARRVRRRAGRRTPRSPRTVEPGIWIERGRPRASRCGAPSEIDARVRSRGAAARSAGTTLAVKGNIDVDGLRHHRRVPRLRPSPRAHRAGGRRPWSTPGTVVIGITNMDQFATGLVGTRSPYGVCPNAHWDGLISGGSSSGSAVAVATGMVDLALGTDTAGSGRVPAAANGIVGLKPTRGRLEPDRRRAGVRVARLRVGLRPATSRSADRHARSPRRPAMRRPVAAHPAAHGADHAVARPAPGWACPAATRSTSTVTTRRSTRHRRGHRGAAALHRRDDVRARRARRRRPGPPGRHRATALRGRLRGRALRLGRASSSTRTWTRSTPSSARSSRPPAGCRPGASRPTSAPSPAPAAAAAATFGRGRRHRPADGAPVCRPSPRCRRHRSR